MALNAASPEVVDSVYRKLRELDTEVTDASAHYPQYSPGYYAVFFKDPSGLQLKVCHTPDMVL